MAVIGLYLLRQGKAQTLEPAYIQASDAPSPYELRHLAARKY